MKNIVTMFLVATMMFGFAGTFLLAPAATHAAVFEEDTFNQLDVVGGTAYDAEHDPDALPKMIGRIIKIVLGFLGVILIVIVIYAGFLWMTAGGDSDQTKKARDWLTNAIIGLAIVLSAYAITDFIITKLISAATGVDVG